MKVAVAAVLGACAYRGVSDYLNGLGGRLRQARERAGYVQQRAAVEAEIDSGTLSRYELGKIQEPSVPKIIRLAKLYGVRAEWLLTGDPPMVEGEAETRVESDFVFPELLEYREERERSGNPISAEHWRELSTAWDRSKGPPARHFIAIYHEGLMSRDAGRGVPRVEVPAEIEAERGQRPLPATKRRGR